MNRLSLAGAALLALIPYASALAQAGLTPSMPADDKDEMAAVVAGHSAGHRSFFWWLTGDTSSHGPAAATPAAASPVAASPVAASSAPVSSPLAAPAPASSGMKTGSSIGIK